MVQSNGVRVCASYSKRNIYSSVLLEMFVTSCRGGQGPPSPQIAICAHASNMSDVSEKYLHIWMILVSQSTTVTAVLQCPVRVQGGT